METRYEFWEHGQSGQVFAVRMDPVGSVTGVAGPLVSNQIRQSDAPSMPFDGTPRTLSWIEAHRENWYPVDVARPPHY